MPAFFKRPVDCIIATNSSIFHANNFSAAFAPSGELHKTSSILTAFTVSTVFANTCSKRRICLGSIVSRFETRDSSFLIFASVIAILSFVADHCFARLFNLISLSHSSLRASSNFVLTLAISAISLVGR
ncbi:hypothetical protein KBA84_06110, partial [Patescibacteria group bacterium]|nr:hypothetical protein [Patescibacteria group bacterium]